MSTKIEVWKASDGSHWDSEKKADEHDIACAMADAIEGSTVGLTSFAKASEVHDLTREECIRLAKKLLAKFRVEWR